MNAGVDSAKLEELAGNLPAELLGGVLEWLESALTVRELLDSIEKSTGRISTIVRAVKEYTHMDEAPLQEIDIHENLENTLTILSYKMRHATIEVVQEFDRTLPRIYADGGELNQVWTNLLDNAIDALEEREGPRQIRIRTSRENDEGN